MVCLKGVRQGLKGCMVSKKHEMVWKALPDDCDVNATHLNLEQTAELLGATNGSTNKHVG